MRGSACRRGLRDSRPFSGRAHVPSRSLPPCVHTARFPRQDAPSAKALLPSSADFDRARIEPGSTFANEIDVIS